MNDSSVVTVNRLAVRIAFASMAIGVLAALALLWGPEISPNWILKRVLISSIIVFVGAALALCTIKYFLTNRGRQ